MSKGTRMEQTRTYGGHLTAGRTLRRMAANVRESVSLPLVWETAKTIVADVPARDEIAQSAAIRKWMAERFRFVKDPLGVELLETPAYLLDKVSKFGFVQGDCDDAATMAAALGAACGIPATLHAVAFHPGEPFSHVYTQLHPLDKNGKRRRYEMDVTRPAAIPHLPRVARELVESA